MRFQMGKMSRPIGDGAERYRFHADGFEEEIDGAARQYDWRMVGDMAAKRDALFLRTGTVLHAFVRFGRPRNEDRGRYSCGGFGQAHGRGRQGAVAAGQPHAA